MMMCTRCKKRPAVVFVSPSTDMNATQGYCLVCAKELGIKPVNDIMEKMGITEEQLEAMTESMNDLMSMSDDGSFEPGGAVPFPSELLGQFGMNANGDGTEPATRESQPNDKKKKENFHKSKRKHIAAYCTDLTMKARKRPVQRGLPCALRQAKCPRSCAKKKCSFWISRRSSPVRSSAASLKAASRDL